MKFCKDCKHYESKSLVESWVEKRWFRSIQHERSYGPIFCCKAPAYDLVNGNNLNPKGGYGCDYRRHNENDDCGPEGKLWEAKE